MNKVFLKAEWRKLVMINYEIDPAILTPYLPFKTELDYWSNTCYVSLIGFMFCNTLLKGFSIPWHINFEEVNLRFYVRYHDGVSNEWKRGVVFIKEIVPRPALTFVANTFYKEKYQTMPMTHTWQHDQDALTVSYKWKLDEWHNMRVVAETSPIEIAIGSEAEFITEHYWGYTKITNAKTSEYKVEHPRWQIYPVKEHSVSVDFKKVYGKDFMFLQNQKPKSVFLAEGSEVTVRGGSMVV